MNGSAFSRTARGKRGARALPSDARDHNRALALRVLYHEGPMSRAQLSRETGLAKVTISDMITRLLEAGYVEELGLQEVSGPGKPATLVDLARDKHPIIGIDLSDHTNFVGAVLDLDANTVERLEIPRNGAVGEQAIELVGSLIEALIEKTDRPILGIGVGTPGIVSRDGTVKLAQNLRWYGVDLQTRIQERFDLPTVVGNDANLATLAESMYGDASDNFALVRIGPGIGAGFMIDGQVAQGANDAVGEIGVVMLGTPEGLDSSYDPNYTLEGRLSAPVLERELAGKDEEEKEQILSVAASLLGISLAPLIAALDLSEVVLAGPSEVVSAKLAEETKQTVLGRVLPGTHEDLLVRVAKKCDEIVLQGCAAQVLSTLLGVSRRHR